MKIIKKKQKLITKNYAKQNICKSITWNQEKSNTKNLKEQHQSFDLHHIHS